ncbi:MAG: SHOCT domain-containing protein [Coriobacteriia bacterium]|nr:SHOCT domain-containing protein [Coriobacteriia bacterium]
MMGGYGQWPGYNMMNSGWFGGVLMLLFGALVLAGIVLLVIWAVKASGGHGAAGGFAPPPGAVGHDEAVAIAKRRFANGEITKEQYEELMTALGG